MDLDLIQMIHAMIYFNKHLVKLIDLDLDSNNINILFNNYHHFNNKFNKHQ